MTIALDRPIPKTTDQIVIVQGDWAKFKLIQQGCAESPGIRVSYFDGTIEIVMPARPHEIFSDVFHVLLSTSELTSSVQGVQTRKPKASPRRSPIALIALAASSRFLTYRSRSSLAAVALIN
jgi:hypothetical protein